MAKKKNKKKKSFADELWDTFSKTGDIGLYLLYKNLNGNNNNNNNF